MLRWLSNKGSGVIISSLACALILQVSVVASPFGQGVFGADVPFGSDTSMSISLGGNVTLTMNPVSNTFVGSGSHTITVTSTDVVGYRLYAYSPSSTNMVNGSDTIAASSNTSANPLSTDTWGFNTTGSTTNYLGMTTSPQVITDSSGPHKTGENTSVTYGLIVSATKGAGQYTVPVVYTAVSKSQ